MRNSIKEYIELNTTEKSKLWNKATFIFDTNIFLRLYGLTNDARDAFFDAIKKIKDRIWMPHQIAEEFMKNRIKIILDNIKNYEELKEETKTYLKKLSNVFNINDSNEECLNYSNKLNKWIDKHCNENLLVKDFNKDIILEKLLELFEGKTGISYTSDEIALIEKEGEERFKKEIPPGYKDESKKKNNDILNNIYGDLIIWKEIIKYAKDNNKDVIFITNDKKPDWWNIINGKTIGPRIELRKEFMSETNNRIFHMYTLESFLKFSTTNIDEKILEEVKIEPININDETFFDYVFMNKNIRHYKINGLKNKVMNLSYKYDVYEKIFNIIANSKKLSENEKLYYLKYLLNNKEDLINKTIKLNDEIDKLNYEIDKYTTEDNE